MGRKRRGGGEYIRNESSVSMYILVGFLDCTSEWRVSFRGGDRSTRSPYRVPSLRGAPSIQKG